MMPSTFSNVCREDEARQEAEEAKLERLRRKIADHELQIARGHLAVNEEDLGGTLQDVGAQSEDSDKSLSMHQGVGAACPMHLCDSRCLPFTMS